MASVSCNGCNSPAVPPYFGPTPLMRTTTETLPTWAIVVIVFGILLILILIAVIIFCLCRLGCWCCAAADTDDERKKKRTFYGWYGRRGSAAIRSKRPQILYRYPDDDAAAIVARNGDDSSGSGYIPRALRLTNDRRPKTVRVVEDVNFNDDGRPVVFVDGGRSSVIGGSTLSSSRVLRGGSVDAEDVRSDIVYGSRPHPAVITINGQGISSYGGDGITSGGYGHGHGHEGVLGSHSASIQVVGGHGSPWSAAPVPSIYPAL